MSAQLITTPPQTAFSRNWMPVILQTDNITNDRAYIELVLTDYDGPAPGESFSFSYNAITRAFTFAATPDNTGWQLPTRDTNAQTPEQYWAYLTERLRINAAITQDFDITSDEIAFKIRLTWRNIEPLSITFVNNIGYMAITAHSVAAISSVTNLGAYITVHNAQTHEQLIALAGSYDTTTRQCLFDIRAAFDQLQPHLPSALWYGIATAAYMPYYVRYADRYGAPPVPEIMHKSDNKTVVLGGTTSGINSRFSDGPIIPLHNWKTRTGDIFRKEVSKEQPDWLYITSQVARAGLVSDVLIHLSDGTSFSAGDQTFDLAANEIRYIGTGFRQLNLHRTPFPRNTAPSGFIVGYDFRIKNDSGDYLLITRYDLELDNQHANFFLLFDTGLGGMETVRLKGKRQIKYEAERTIIENFEGEMSSLFPSANEVIDASTGWYDFYYLEQLRQLLLGDIYLIERISPFDFVSEEVFTFKKCVADSKSFAFVPDDNELHSLEFIFKTAKSDTQINNY